MTPDNNSNHNRSTRIQSVANILFIIGTIIIFIPILAFSIFLLYAAARLLLG